jgi:hypothetical protein
MMSQTVIVGPNRCNSIETPVLLSSIAPVNLAVISSNKSTIASQHNNTAKPTQQLRPLYTTTTDTQSPAKPAGSSKQSKKPNNRSAIQRI